MVELEGGQRGIIRRQKGYLVKLTWTRRSNCGSSGRSFKLFDVYTQIHRIGIEANLLSICIIEATEGIDPEGKSTRSRFLQTVPCYLILR